MSLSHGIAYIFIVLGKPLQFAAFIFVFIYFFYFSHLEGAILSHALVQVISVFLLFTGVGFQVKSKGVDWLVKVEEVKYVYGFMMMMIIIICGMYKSYFEMRMNGV